MNNLYTQPLNLTSQYQGPQSNAGLTNITNGQLIINGTITVGGSLYQEANKMLDPTTRIETLLKHHKQKFLREKFDTLDMTRGLSQDKSYVGSVELTGEILYPTTLMIQDDNGDFLDYDSHYFVIDQRVFLTYMPAMPLQIVYQSPDLYVSESNDDALDAYNQSIQTFLQNYSNTPTYVSSASSGGFVPITSNWNMDTANYFPTHTVTNNTYQPYTSSMNVYSVSP